MGRYNKGIGKQIKLAGFVGLSVVSVALAGASEVYATGTVDIAGDVAMFHAPYLYFSKRQISAFPWHKSKVSKP